MYIPKNKIKPNLYTGGNEFVIKSSGENYAGYYFQLYTGKYYTGKNLNDKPNKEIIKQSSNTDDALLATSLDPTNGSGFQQYASNYDGNFPNQNPDAMRDTDIYNKNKNVNISSVKLIPQQYYPTPTNDDYMLGSFARYFVVKRNELIYLEVDKKTHDKLSKQDPKWSFDLYLPFNFQWLLIGDKKEVYNTNRNQVLLIEKKLKRQGLRLFLKENYLQFYQD